MAVPDIQIRTNVRSVLTRHWIDLARLSFDCCCGSVRFRGEISFAEGHRCSSPAALLETLESEIKRIPGVKSVYLMGVTVNTDSRRSQDKDPSGKTAGLELSVSDVELSRRVRAVLNKHWIDLTRIGYDCCRGAVCFSGEIALAEGHHCSSPGALIETLESEIKQISGVKSIYLVGVTINTAPCARLYNAPSEESTKLELTVSDLEIKQRVNAVLNKHRIDLAQVEFDCCKGTLSFKGRICFVDGARARGDGPAILDVLLVELKRIRGVRQVYFMGLKFGKATKSRKPKNDDVSNSRVVNVRGVRRHT